MLHCTITKSFSYVIKYTLYPAILISTLCCVIHRNDLRPDEIHFMKRRYFILNASVLATFSFLPFQRIFGNKLNAHDKFIWADLVEYARWCPSPHNVQPWKIKVISASEAHLYYDPARIPIVVDGTSAFTI